MKEEEAQEKGIKLEALREEQKKLAKAVVLKDSFDFKLTQRFGAIIIEVIDREILASCVILDENMNVIEEKYAIQKVKFPYIPGFRAYRELPVMLEAYNKLEEQPDVIFLLGHGIAHPTGLGIASHFGVTVQKPTIGIAKQVIHGEENEEDVTIGKKIIAKKLVTKQGSKPIYVSSGHLISLKTAVELTAKCIREPHKLPEPIVAARKFASRIREELVS